jgi:hypothetical protein
VTELIRDYESVAEINEQLEKMGYSMGVRCVDELLAKADQAGMNLPSCQSLADTAEVVAKIGFRMFLGVAADVQMISDTAFILSMSENPLALFVELPQDDDGGDSSSKTNWKDLKYSNLYCGILRGSLEQVNLRVECTFVKDMLQGDDVNEIRVELKEVLADGAGDEYQEE